MIFGCVKITTAINKTKTLKSNFKKFFIGDILIALEFKLGRKCYWFKNTELRKFLGLLV